MSTPIDPDLLRRLIDRPILTPFPRPFPFPQPGPIPPAPKPEPLPTDSLQEALDRIPTAQAGDIIGPDYHNTLRDFCRVVALAVGGAVDLGLTVEVPIGFLPNGDKLWSVELGMARNADKLADGWVPAGLPHGVTITGVKVIGRRSGKAGTVNVLLLRTNRADPNERVTLVTVPLSGFGDGPFETPVAPVKPSVPQLTPEQIPAYAKVNNTAFSYLVQAVVTGQPDADSTRLFGIQILCDRL